MNNHNSDEKLAELSRGLANKHRVVILKILANRPKDDRCMVNNIVEKLPLAQSTVSQHLKVLKQTGWIKGEVEGPGVCYCLKEDMINNYQQLLEGILEL